MAVDRSVVAIFLSCLGVAACGDEGGVTGVAPGGGAGPGGSMDGSGPTEAGARKPLKCVTETRDPSSHRLLALKFDYFDRTIRLVRTERDLDADGSLDTTQSWTYAENGRVEEDAYDADADGELDVRWIHRYRADDLLSESRGDTDGDGAIDVLRRYVYGAGGVLQQRDEDLDADGAYDARTRYRLDARGNVMLIELDADLDGTAEARIEYRYDDRDHVLEIASDWNADGRVDQRDLFTYAPNVITQERDLDGDGSADEIWIRRHQDDGRITSIDVDLDADGTPERRMAFDYECFALVDVPE